MTKVFELFGNSKEMPFLCGIIIIPSGIQEMPKGEEIKPSG